MTPSVIRFASTALLSYALIVGSATAQSTTSPTAQRPQEVPQGQPQQPPTATSSPQQPTSPQPAAQPQPQPSTGQTATQPQTTGTGGRQEGQPASGRVFGANAGIIFNQIKPDKTADFEAVMARLKEALQASTDPVRKQQAAGWRVFRSVEPGPNGSVLYLFWMNPAVKGADYTVSKILAEAFPTEAQALYKQFSDAFAGGQSLVNLELVQNFGEGASTAVGQNRP